jgi:integrase
VRESLRFPTYRRHATGQAVVTIRGRDYYLGKHGSLDSRARYRQLIAEYAATGRIASDHREEPDEGPTIAELMVAYVKHCDQYYRGPDGKVSNQVLMIRLALRTLRSLYSDLPASDFGPLKLKTVQAAFIQEGLARTEVNRRTGLIKQFCEWAVSQELMPPHQIDALKCVKGLQPGRTTARETEPVEPVEESRVEATLPHLPSQIAEMVRVQMLTGMRPQEVVQITTEDIDRSREIWEFRPRQHKNLHRGKQRVVMIGPRGQEILGPWLRPDEPERPLFSPRDRMTDLSIERRSARKSPLTPSQRARRPNPGRARAPGDRYTTGSYRRAIHRACQSAGIPNWSPNQIRHTTGTRLRSKAGLDVASVVLGHAKPDTTLIYAERDLDVARSAMAQFG